jgi:hypothetical protein
MGRAPTYLSLTTRRFVYFIFRPGIGCRGWLRSNTLRFKGEYATTTSRGNKWSARMDLHHRSPKATGLQPVSIAALTLAD